MTRRTLQIFTSLVVVFCAYWNMWTYEKSVASLPDRNSDELVVQEDRYRPIQQMLIEARYRSGPIGFVTNRDLKPGPNRANREEDGNRWSQAQYVMVPWILLRNGRAVSGVTIPDTTPPFVIGDFWDAEPSDIPDDLVKVYDSGARLVLFRRRPPQ